MTVSKLKRAWEAEVHSLLLRDLRPTFAADQITSRIRRKEELDQMLTALAEYMGNAGLESTDYTFD